MFEARLRALGWSKAEFGRRLGLSSNTVSEWGDDLPQYAEAYLSACERLHMFVLEGVEFFRPTDGRRKR